MPRSLRFARRKNKRSPSRPFCALAAPYFNPVMEVKRGRILPDRFIQKDVSMRPRLTSLIAIAAILAAAPVIASAQTALMMPPPTTLSISAAGDVSATPDMATISFGVTTQAKSASSAMQANNVRMNQVMAALKAAGIADKDVQTSSLNLNAQYDYPANLPQVLTGYQASDQVSVKVEDLKQTGPVIDAVIKAGVNQVDSISFGLKNDDALLDQARQAAVTSLMQRADLYAKATGLRVKRLLTLSEGYVDTPQPPRPIYAMAKMAGSAATPVAAGELHESITVSATFELGQ